MPFEGETIAVNCPACGVIADSSPETIVYPRRLGDSGALDLALDTIALCPACGFGLARPLPSEADLDRYYKESQYWSFHDVQTVDRRSHPGPAALAQARWHMVEPWISRRDGGGIRILDIGAGLGQFGLAAAASKSVALASYVAVEPDPVVCQAVALGWGQRGIQATIEVHQSIDDVNGSFDVVVASHVLEHVRDPVSFIRSLIGHVKPGGLLFIDVPHSDYRFKDDVFPHLSFFTEDSLKHLVERCGGRTRQVLTCGRTWQDGLPGGRAPLVRRIALGLANRWPHAFPESWVVAAHGWHLGVALANPDGPWLRIVASKSVAAG